MQAGAVTLADAVAGHFAAIFAIEAEAPGGSLVALTHGHALGEALARGHRLTVALAGDEVAGWAWCATEPGRGGELLGQVYRVAVARAYARRGIGRALMEHAGDTLAAAGATRIRVSLDAADGDARAFLERLGFAAGTLTMERTP